MTGPMGFSGFNSGLPIDDIIAKMIQVESQPINLMAQRKSSIQKQQTAYNAVKTRIADLLTAIKKMTNRGFDGSTIFDTMLGTTSNDKIATATATASATPQNLTLEVKSLAGATKAASTTGVGTFDATTPISALGITTGSFTMYVEGVSYNIAVNNGETIGDVLERINTTIPDAYIDTDPTVVDNKINITYLGGTATDIIMGAGGDTSNFLAKTYLATGINDGAGAITASQRASTIDLTQLVSDPLANLATAVTDGTFNVNGISFDTTGKSMNQLITEINASAANVVAKFNTSNNSFEITAKDNRSQLINLTDGTGNFLTAMNLIVAGDSTVSQTAGKNAEFVLNGTTLYSTSNSINETVTGMTGITLDLKKAEVGTTVTIGVARDVASLKTAVKDVIDKYNAAITFIDQQTDAKAGGALAGQSRLIALRGQIRGLFTSQVSGLAGTAYDSLQQVGISTGAVSGTASASAKLQLDEAKLEAAILADPAAIEKLFVGQNLGGALDGTIHDDQMDGTLTRLMQALSDTTYTTSTGASSFGALYDGGTDDTKGLFAAYQLTTNKRISSIDKSITRAEERLELRERALRQQFLAMDKLIGELQSQGNALNGLIQMLNASQK